jgi:hypothetical protein
MTTATQKLHDIIRRDIESGTNPHALEYGHDWFNLTPAEAEVFGLDLHDMASLVAVWTAYEEVLRIISPVLNIPEDIAAGVRAEHSWLAETFNPDITTPSVIDTVQFQKFAKLFGVPFRKSAAWWSKHQFWYVRSGVTRYVDDEETARAQPPYPFDDDIPF